MDNHPKSLFLSLTSHTHSFSLPLSHSPFFSSIQFLDPQYSSIMDSVERNDTDSSFMTPKFRKKIKGKKFSESTPAVTPPSSSIRSSPTSSHFSTPVQTSSLSKHRDPKKPHHPVKLPSLFDFIKVEDKKRLSMKPSSNCNLPPLAHISSVSQKAG